MRRRKREFEWRKRNVGQMMREFWEEEEEGV